MFWCELFCYGMVFYVMLWNIFVMLLKMNIEGLIIWYGMVLCFVLIFEWISIFLYVEFKIFWSKILIKLNVY